MTKTILFNDPLCADREQNRGVSVSVTVKVSF
jgi:hypothetical protein